LLYPEAVDRVKGVEFSQANWVTKLVYRVLKKKIGRIPKSKALAAHHTQLLLSSTWMDAIVASAKTVPIVLKELVQLKVAVLVGCPF